ncbi:Sporulation protein YpeB [Neomoorella glycerini]|uniref:Sporulation protein YpeB n=1 Tax=Neomoorella glycerini TaxID=55779 RepID=A0A6I5ZR28_9FIRM|nr:germination protein YpeB [Moorella glycerini]QGP92176.1 Sporulation protein YpeB [Moorella glycerini]
MTRRISTIVLTLALLLAVGWGLWERANRLTLANAVEAGGQRDFYNLLNYVEQAQVSMGKSLASSSPRQQAVHLTEAWNQAAAAQLSLSQLPTPGIKPINTSKFLAQTSDYNNYLAQKLARGGELSSQEREQLARLRDEMKRLAVDLRQTEGQVASKGLRWSSFYSTRMPAPLRTIANLAIPVQAQPGPLDGFVNADRRLQTLPSLNYDGPFSDHLEKPRPLGLKGGDVSQAEAERRATAFANDASNSNYRVQATRTSNGLLPTFALNLVDNRRPSVIVHIDISKQGGEVISLLNTRPVGAPTLDAAKALERATAFLKAHGFASMQPTYTVRTDNNQVITFAAKEGDVILYPDQVKVKVALDNGEITGWDATPYYMAHHRRQLPTPKLTPAEARAKINPGLKVEGVRLALIPLPGGIEKLTYEVKTKLDDTRYLTYINAVTGEEEKVLQIVDVPGGQLTM